MSYTNNETLNKITEDYYNVSFSRKSMLWIGPNIVKRILTEMTRTSATMAVCDSNQDTELMGAYCLSVDWNVCSIGMESSRVNQLIAAGMEG